MTDILGHDCSGRPLRAGDEVVILHSDKGNTGRLVKVVGIADDGDIKISIKAPSGNWRETKGEYLRKLDNHQPAGSFDEVMAGLKQPQQIGESQ